MEHIPGSENADESGGLENFLINGHKLLMSYAGEFGLMKRSAMDALETELVGQLQELRQKSQLNDLMQIHCDGDPSLIIVNNSDMEAEWSGSIIGRLVEVEVCATVECSYAEPNDPNGYDIYGHPDDVIKPELLLGFQPAFLIGPYAAEGYMHWVRASTIAEAGDPESYHPLLADQEIFDLELEKVAEYMPLSPDVFNAFAETLTFQLMTSSQVLGSKITIMTHEGATAESLSVQTSQHSGLREVVSTDVLVDISDVKFSGTLVSYDVGQAEDTAHGGVGQPSLLATFLLDTESRLKTGYQSLRVDVSDIYLGKILERPEEIPQQNDILWPSINRFANFTKYLTRNGDREEVYGRPEEVIGHMNVLSGFLWSVVRVELTEIIDVDAEYTPDTDEEESLLSLGPDFCFDAIFTGFACNLHGDMDQDTGALTDLDTYLELRLRVNAPSGFNLLGNDLFALKGIQAVHVPPDYIKRLQIISNPNIN